MQTDRYEPDVETVGDRESGVVPTPWARQLCAMARRHHIAGDAARAEDAAHEALDAWLVDPDGLDEEELVELLEDVCGVVSRAIVDTVLSARAQAAWSRRTDRSSR